MTVADLDKIEAELIKGSVMSCEHVCRLRALLLQLRALLSTP